MVFWVPLIMGAAALSGAIMSANGKKYIDPQWIEEHTGSHAFAQEFNKMFNQLQSSPQGQEMINSAMSQGAQISNAIKQNATNAGFGGAEGVQSGGSLFATSVADSAPNAMRRMALAAIGQQAQGSVNDILQRRLNAYLAERQQPSRQEVIGNMLMQGGMMGLKASLASLDKSTDDSGGKGDGEEEKKGKDGEVMGTQDNKDGVLTGIPETIQQTAAASTAGQTAAAIPPEYSVPYPPNAGYTAQRQAPPRLAMAPSRPARNTRYVANQTYAPQIGWAPPNRNVSAFRNLNTAVAKNVGRIGQLA